VAMWQVQEAKRQFSEVLRRAADEGGQIVTRHGVEVAAVVDITEYRQLKELAAQRRPHPGLLFPLLDDPEFADVVDDVVAARGQATSRSQNLFED